MAAGGYTITGNPCRLTHSRFRFRGDGKGVVVCRTLRNSVSGADENLGKE